MPLRGTWRDNEKQAQWEAVIGPYHCVARFDHSSGRYMAFIEDAATEGTNHYAPESFTDPEAAKAWCEAEIDRLEQLGEPPIPAQ